MICILIFIANHFCIVFFRYNHSNDLFQSNLRDNFDENLKIDENFTKHKGMAFDEIYQPGVASKRKTAEGFYRILSNYFNI